MPHEIIDKADDHNGRPLIKQVTLETDPQADANLRDPRRKTLEAYTATLDRLHLDGFVYPATQMPPPDGPCRRMGKSAAAHTAIPAG